ncbi:nucleotidyltransferase domain-containing protein [Clostridium sp.]|uniref:nucleotidyltransferase domain-containing protein n=1 Tax=Clostridium sp. TaxID=1506 RepID=UPI0026DD4A01|nr:nucleotidyltransferase domain-containing protein [Clostridium sp.]MDO5038823.1 nucleotidyltransferase domain-containing protein [Clostridium sp.]
MKDIIIEYQKAFNIMMETFESNENVIAVFTFGSMVSGDIWNESDIDFFVIYKDEFNKVRDVYSEVNNIPVHTKLLSKDSFVYSYENEGKRGIVKSILSFSKLVFSRDKDINVIYNKIIYGIDEYAGIGKLEYLSKVIKDVKIAKKYINLGRMYTAYEVMVRSLDSFSKLYLSLNGYTVSKDAIRMVINLDDSFKRIIDEKLFGKMNKEDISYIINYIENFIDKHIAISAKVIIDILKSNKDYLSSTEIKKDEMLVGYNIKVEQILKKLLEQGIIKHKKRNVYDKKGNLILTQNVYGIL